MCSNLVAWVSSMARGSHGLKFVRACGVRGHGALIGFWIPSGGRLKWLGGNYPMIMMIGLEVFL